MILYGKINEKGFLSVKPVREKKEIRTKIVFPDNFGKEVAEQYEYTITVEEQIAALKKEGWKPADEVNPEQLICGENEKVIPIHVIGESRITYDYEKVIDKELVQRKIENLKKEVATSDYQVRKCQEYALVGKQMPYDIQAIHIEAEKIRTQIRELEKLL